MIKRITTEKHLFLIYGHGIYQQNFDLAVLVVSFLEETLPHDLFDDRVVGEHSARLQPFFSGFIGSGIKTVGRRDLYLLQAFRLFGVGGIVGI